MKFKRYLVTVFLIFALACISLFTGASIVAADPGTTYEETLDIYEYSVGGQIQWTHYYDGSANPIDHATLTIVADDVDGPGDGLSGEQDKVYINGHYVGLLNNMGFYTSWEYHPGPGNPDHPEAITTTTFDINLAWLDSMMPVAVDIQIYWGAEIETSTLTVVSESVTVGGTTLPTDKLGLMMPWIMVGALIVIAGVLLAIYNKKLGIERASDR